MVSGWHFYNQHPKAAKTIIVFLLVMIILGVIIAVIFQKKKPSKGHQPQKVEAPPKLSTGLRKGPS